jgi:hypothetical protein
MCVKSIESLFQCIYIHNLLRIVKRLSFFPSQLVSKFSANKPKGPAFEPGSVEWEQAIFHQTQLHLVSNAIKVAFRVFGRLFHPPIFDGSLEARFHSLQTSIARVDKCAPLGLQEDNDTGAWRLQ